MKLFKSQQQDLLDAQKIAEEDMKEEFNLETSNINLLEDAFNGAF